MTLICRKPRHPLLNIALGLGLALTLSGCKELVTDQYEAVAVTTYTWQAEYRPQGVTPDRPREGRIETFETNSLVNLNGQPTVEPTGDQDASGIWWPALPPKPTVDDLEARQKAGEVYSEPLIQQSVDYRLTFDQAGETVTLPTNAGVYREAVKAYEQGRSLEVLLGPQNAHVQKAEMQ
jgi:hypothetical protein